MESQKKSQIQQLVNNIPDFWTDLLPPIKGIPADFRPWTCGLSPSALYNCSLPLRKEMNLKTQEVKWISIKRWVQVTPSGITLPNGVYLSIKRYEAYVSDPKPHFQKTEYTLLMFPHGNVWSQITTGIPITEDWIWSEVSGMIILEALLRKDASKPVVGYFKSVYDFMTENPDQIGIHLKRKRRNPQTEELATD